MKLSIIVPVYNVELYLRECLDSLINQNYHDYEIIAINDGSLDNSLEILREYEKKYPKLLKVYDQKNAGVSSARNYGIKKAKGKYIFFVDSDDYILKDALCKLDKYLEEENDVIIFNCMVGDELKNELFLTSDKSINDVRKRMIVGIPGPFNKIYKKDLLLKNNIFFLEGVYYEDLATMPKVALHTEKIKFIDEVLYFYRVRENSTMTKKEYNPKMDAIFKVLKELRRYFKNNYSSEIEYLHIEHLLRSASIRYLGFNNCQKQLDKIIKIIKEIYPYWYKNEYFKKESIKKRIMCHLIYRKQYRLIKLLRHI